MMWFWLILTIAALVWYSTVTVYVAARGGVELKRMLIALRTRQRDDDAHRD